MLPDRVSNPGPLTYESGALSIALRGPDCDEFEKGIKNEHGRVASLESVPINVKQSRLPATAFSPLRHTISCFYHCYNQQCTIIKLRSIKSRRIHDYVRKAYIIHAFLAR